MNSSPDVSAEIEVLLAKQALHELIAAYCRAVDRLDEPAFVALFHSDAIIDSGVLRGDPAYFAREFNRWVRLNARVIFHAVTNEWFVIDGVRAIGESYVVALSRVHGDSGERDVLTLGRYFDRFERRNGSWKISERRFVFDHSVTLAEGVAPLPDRDAPSEGRGRFAPHDPIYRFWQKGDVG